MLKPALFLFVFAVTSKVACASFQHIQIRLSPHILWEQYDFMTCQSVKLFFLMAVWRTLQMLNPHTVIAVSMLFHTALTLTPWLWETVAQGEQSEVKAAEFAYLSIQMNTHMNPQRHTSTAMLCYMRPQPRRRLSGIS